MRKQIYKLACMFAGHVRQAVQGGSHLQAHHPEHCVGEAEGPRFSGSPGSSRARGEGSHQEGENSSIFYFSGLLFKYVITQAVLRIRDVLF